MSILIVGLLLFIGIHLVPGLPVRDRLKQKLGDNGYKGLFSVISLIGLIVIIWGKTVAPFEPVWTPPPWSRHLAWVAMLPVFYLLAAANMPSNIKRLTRHPMMWGVLIWAIVHLFANGDLASIILFAGIGLWAPVSMWLETRRDGKTPANAVPIAKDLIIVAAAIVVYIVFAVAHPWLFGVPAFI